MLCEDFQDFNPLLFTAFKGRVNKYKASDRSTKKVRGNFVITESSLIN